MIKIVNALSSQAWYFLFAMLGCFVALFPVLPHVHVSDPGTITAYIGLGSTLIGVAAGGLQSDAKKTTVTDSPSGTTTKTTVQTPAAPPAEPPVEPPTV